MNDAAAKSADESGDIRRFISRQIAADYWVYLALDTPETISYPDAQTLAETGLDQDDLMHRALTNFMERLPEQLTMSEQENITFVGIDGFYDTSLLLMDPFWNVQAAEMRGALVMVAPARDMVLFVDSADKKALDLMINYARENIDLLPRPVSSAPLEWSKNGWRRFDK